MTYHSNSADAGDTVRFSAISASRTDARYTRSPLIVFIGNCVVFSDRLLRLVEAEFDAVSVLRLGDADELDALDPDLRRAVQMIVIDEAHLDCLPLLLAESLPGLVHPRWVLAYRTTDEARRLLGALGEGRPVGFLPMKVALDAWLAALRLLSLGEDFLPGELLDAPPPGHVPQPLVAPTQAPTLAPSQVPPRGPGPAAAATPIDTLTGREAEILDLVARGRRNKAIARELGLSEHTVKLHVHHIFGKLGVRNRTSATHLYLSRASGIAAGAPGRGGS
ncbi:helix-turn-helix transcriptional regulator [Palleronia sp. KMU-117]|uniref:helix-turn-helix transcriptional regulator n=1 Tax=Palleronia sp. KMU-117 TaxID=3434108 RepID=UPI003D762A16